LSGELLFDGRVSVGDAASKFNSSCPSGAAVFFMERPPFIGELSAMKAREQLLDDRDIFDEWNGLWNWNCHKRDEILASDYEDGERDDYSNKQNTNSARMLNAF
jgi:hypothetical protein